MAWFNLLINIVLSLSVHNTGHISPHLITNWAESITFPQPLLVRIPPFPTTAHVSHVLFGKGRSWEHNKRKMNYTEIYGDGHILCVQQKNILLYFIYHYFIGCYQCDMLSPTFQIKISWWSLTYLAIKGHITHNLNEHTSEPSLP